MTPMAGGVALGDSSVFDRSIRFHIILVWT